MNSMITKAAITGAAAVAALGIAVGPAGATNLTVSGGPNFTATSSNLTLHSGSITISCTSATKVGSVVDGSYTTPAQIGSITGFTVSGCTAFGLAATVTDTASASNPWPLVATSAPSGGTTAGEVRNVDATVNVPSLGCTVHITGTAPGNWTNSPEAITFTGGSLTTSGSGFCLGLGSTGSLSGNFSVVGSPTNPIVLS